MLNTLFDNLLYRDGKQYDIVKTYALAWRAANAAKRLGLHWTANGNGYAVIRLANPRKEI